MSSRDGATTRYAFHHVPYQQVAYERLGAAWRVRLHRRIGAFLEEASGERAPEIAAELAMHFGRGRDHARAVYYLRQAAATASQRHAHREAIDYLQRALELLQTLPNTPERDRGEPSLAQQHLRQAIASYEPQQHHALAFNYGYDPGAYARAMDGWVLWLLGHPEQALRRSREALALARDQSHPFNSSLILAMAAVLRQLRQEGEATPEQVRASLALSTAHGFPYLQAVGTILHGWGVAKEGQLEAGIAEMRQGLAALRATGAEVFRPYLPALLAEACDRAGQIEAGLCALEEALTAAHEHAERFYEAELYRLKGEFLLRQAGGAGSKAARAVCLEGAAAAAEAAGSFTAAEACFQRATEIARRQGAKSLELRAAMSLHRLWTRQGQRARAWQLLSEVYTWFSEGFDTADLRAAGALLGRLRHTGIERLV